MDPEDSSALHFLNSHIRPLSRPQISHLRLDLFQLLNGDIFYPIKIWLREIQTLFWKKPTSDADTFKLLLFFIGNGCPPSMIANWILSSQHWGTYQKASKRARQIDFIIKNLPDKGNIWFYFDLHFNDWLYLNGKKREYVSH